MYTIIAYVVAPLLIAPLGPLAFTPIIFLSFIKPSAYWSAIAGFAGAIAAYYLCRAFFDWLDVSYHWYSYLLCMVPIMFNDGIRCQREREHQQVGPDAMHAAGCALGMLYSLAQHFWN